MFLLAKYNTQTTIYFNVVKRGVVDLAATGDWTPATGDTKVSKDGGSFANTTNNPTAVGGTGSVGWSLTLTATELSAAVVHVQIVDSATKAVEDQALVVYTYGNASAKIPVDLSDTVRAGLTALPNAAAEAAGGLFTRGSGAGQINQQANGQVDANIARWLNTAAATPNTAGKPLVDIDLWKGSVPNALSSGRVDGSVGAMASGVLTATAIAADAITAAKLAADAGAEIADAVWDEALSGHATGGSAGAALTGAGSAGDPWSTTIPGAYGAGTAGERLGRIPNVAAGGNGGIVLADANGRAKADVERWLTGTPNGLQSGRVDAYVGAVASAVIAAASFASGALDAVWATATRTLTAFGFSVTVGTNNDKTGYRLSATGVDDVWDEALSGHLSAGTTGAKLNDAGGAGTPPTVAAIADAVWDEALSGHLSAGSTGLKLSSAGGAGGSGTLARTIGVTVAGNPLQAASVWLSTDIGGTNVVAGPLITNSSGVVTALVDAGTYYVWVRKDGFNPIVAQAVTVS